MNTRANDENHSELVRILRQWSLVAVVFLNFAAIVGFANRIQVTLDQVRATEARHCDLTRDALILAVESSRDKGLSNPVADRIVSVFRQLDCSP